MKKILLLSIITVILTTLNCGKPNEQMNTFKIISTLGNPGYSQSIWIDTINSKHYAFIASGQAGLVIYNIDNPESTYIVAQWKDSLNSCWDVMTLHGNAYLAYGKRELIVINSKNVDSLRYVDEYNWPSPGNSRSIFIQDTSNIFVGALDRLLVSSVAEPAFPTEYYPPSNVRGIFIVDSFAYIASEQLGIYVMNVLTTPRQIINICDTPSNARSVFVQDNYCYVADGRNGLLIFDVSNPRQIASIAELKLSGYANKVFVKDTLAYIACGEAGLMIVNIKDKTNPSLIEAVKTSYARSIYVSYGDYIYVADRDLGLVVIKQEE